MAARPPPTRPHINLNPSSHFSYSITEWGEDDAWDSASDSESASNSQSVWGRSLNQPGHPRPSGTTSTSTSAPKPVPAPRKSQNSSSSTLALSYTAEIANGTCGAFCSARFILFTYTRRRSFAPFESSGCWAAWPYPVVAVVVVTTLEIVVPALRRAVGKTEARAVRQGQSSSQVHRVSVARGRGHGFVFLLSSFTNPSPRTII